jgi:hypothetical protein
MDLCASQGRTWTSRTLSGTLRCSSQEEQFQLSFFFFSLGTAWRGCRRKKRKIDSRKEPVSHCRAPSRRSRCDVGRSSAKADRRQERKKKKEQDVQGMASSKRGLYLALSVALAPWAPWGPLAHTRYREDRSSNQICWAKMHPVRELLGGDGRAGGAKRECAAGGLPNAGQGWRTQFLRRCPKLPKTRSRCPVMPLWLGLACPVMSPAFQARLDHGSIW